MKIKNMFLLLTFAIVFVLSGLTMSILSTDDKVDAVIRQELGDVGIAYDFGGGPGFLPGRPATGGGSPSSGGGSTTGDSPSSGSGSTLITTWAEYASKEAPQEIDDGVYIIDNETELAYLINNVADFNGKTVKLDKDLDMGAHPWEPIGCLESFDLQGFENITYFTGVFDGQNHTIKGLKFPNKDGFFVGLFGATHNATIKNLVVEDSDFSSHWISGAISAYAEDCAFSNILVNKCNIDSNGLESDSIVIGNIFGNAKSGGIVGYQVSGSIKECIVNNTNISSVYSVNKEVDPSKDNIKVYAGGVAGWSDGVTIQTACIKGDSRISAVFLEGSFNEKYSNYAYSGGIAGYASDTTINKCYNDAKEVSAISINKNADGKEYKGTAYAGGIVGELYDSSVTNCFNKSSIHSSAPVQQSVENFESTITDYTKYYEKKEGGLFKTTYTYYIKNGSDNKMTRFSIFAYSGGIVGYADSYSTISNNYNYGTIDNYGDIELEYYFFYEMKHVVDKPLKKPEETLYGMGIKISLKVKYFAGNIVGGINEESIKYDDLAINYYTKEQKEILVDDVYITTECYHYFWLNNQYDLNIGSPLSHSSHYPELPNEDWWDNFPSTAFYVVCERDDKNNRFTFNLSCKYLWTDGTGESQSLRDFNVYEIPDSNHTRIEGYSDENPYVYLDLCGDVFVYDDDDNVKDYITNNNSFVGTLNTNSGNRNIWSQDPNINGGLPYLTDFYW